ncbi:hypothetical protein ZOSMA_92G00650 [Zostera marina]|uniref:DUF4218 domain-containing protein n=1 Tax=Zostera marina TaxID=29655 RepID=A0A0K9NKV6_ZOSMR|nr:hypothetical protein ZOSMA_92G00650 [Zostera marina]
MKIRSELHPLKISDSKWKIPKAIFNLNNEERKFTDLKNHDCHMIMQQLLPIALRRSTHPKVISVLVDIRKYFNAICSKAIVVEHTERLEKSIVITLCNLEKIFPTSFFTITMHLVVHFTSEAKVASPVHYRWMYPIERYLLILKKYVRTRSHPEGSIAEKYLADESMTFCSRFLHTTKKSRQLGQAKLTEFLLQILFLTEIPLTLVRSKIFVKNT